MSRSQQITTRLVAEIALYEPQSTSGGGGIANVFDVIQLLNDASGDVVTSATKNVTVEFENLTATRTATFLAPPQTGQTFTFKDKDGSLATQDFVIDATACGGIDGANVYTMTNITNGPKDSLVVRYDGSNLLIV